MVEQKSDSVQMGAAPTDNDANHKAVSAKDFLLKNIDWPFDTPELFRIAFNFFKGLCAP